MATSVARPEALAHHEPAGILGWITTVDHKKLGILYIVTAIGFFILSGLLALFIRWELAAPGATLSFVTPELYNQFFSMHGTGMIFLFIIPMLVGFGNYLVPLQIGARDMAFPQLNALSYWMYLFAGLLLYSTFMMPLGAAAVGWTGYPPLSNNTFSQGIGTDMWIIGLQVLGVSSLMGAVNFITTIFTMRAPGMSLWRIPVFTWTVLVMA
ncbi:MAG: cbb3-type cytochrome c oxidase subunit I, partial [Anaerolineae bacterium]|nr:cbb3-type cytochrome c oxidase subunit I [Anaerolineae bacterium]